MQLRTEAGVFNRMLFATPDGNLAHYDKRHLFSFAKENERYAAGHDRVSVEWRGWRILLQVCYDLRFPVFSRNRFDVERPACPTTTWRCTSPTGRRRAAIRGRRCCARAIENLCYVVGVNRVGTDGNGLHYSGDSAAIDFLGHPLSEAADEEVVSTMLLQAARAHRAPREVPGAAGRRTVSALDNPRYRAGSSEISLCKRIFEERRVNMTSNQPCLSCSG